MFAFAVGKAAKPVTVWRYGFEPVAEGVQVTESFELTKPLGFGSRLVTRVTTGVKDRPADMEDGVRATRAVHPRLSLGSGPGTTPTVFHAWTSSRGPGCAAPQEGFGKVGVVGSE